MAEKSINIGSSFTKFTFTDETGEVVAHFRMNPADIRIAERAGEVAAFLKANSGNITGETATDVLSQYEKVITEKMDYLLGYDASKTLFSTMSATAIMDDGRFFATVIMDTIAQNLSEEMKRRFEKFKAVNKYTAKYE